MTESPEMRALSAEEIGAVAGGGSVNTITVTETNNANATATAGTPSSSSGYTQKPWGHPGYPHF